MWRVMIVVVLLAGCKQEPRYEMTRDRDGRVVRIDRQAGTVEVEYLCNNGRSIWAMAGREFTGTLWDRLGAGAPEPAGCRS